jgi:hypothetical protein
MKKIVAFITLTFMGIAAVAQNASSNTGAVLSTSMVSSAKITDVTINPNPVKGQNFTLELQNLDKGKYTICAYDNNGKKYLLKVLNTEGGSSTQIVDLPKEITTGTYILQVVSKTARFSKKMVVE